MSCSHTKTSVFFFVFFLFIFYPHQHPRFKYYTINLWTITKEGQRTGGAPPPVPGCEYRTAGDIGVTSEGRVCGEAEGLQGKAEGQQVDAHRQAKL